MTRLLAILGLCLGLPTATLAQSSDTSPTDLVVVELFTSQGCAACPPADEMVAELATHDDVLALSLHVDYWNYLGWADTFSHSAFTERQYAYGHAAGSTMVYTPQLIVGGIDPVMGARAMEVVDLIAAHRNAPRPVTFEVQPAASGVIVSAVWVGDSAAPEMMVQLVRYSAHEVVDITRGENAGRVAEYHNVARQWQVISEWSGRNTFAAEIPLDPNLEEAIIVQVAGHGPILGAARLD